MIEMVIFGGRSVHQCIVQKAKTETVETGNVLHDRTMGDGLRNKELWGRTQLKRNIISGAQKVLAWLLPGLSSVVSGFDILAICKAFFYYYLL
jgi:hypothetical protein